MSALSNLFWACWGFYLPLHQFPYFVFKNWKLFKCPNKKRMVMRVVRKPIQDLYALIYKIVLRKRQMRNL